MHSFPRWVPSPATNARRRPLHPLPPRRRHPNKHTINPCAFQSWSVRVTRPASSLPHTRPHRPSPSGGPSRRVAHRHPRPAVARRASPAALPPIPPSCHGRHRHHRRPTLSPGRKPTLRAPARLRASSASTRTATAPTARWAPRRSGSASPRARCVCVSVSLMVARAAVLSLSLSLTPPRAYSRRCFPPRPPAAGACPVTLALWVLAPGTARPLPSPLLPVNLRGQGCRAAATT